MMHPRTFPERFPMVAPPRSSMHPALVRTLPQQAPGVHVEPAVGERVVRVTVIRHDGRPIFTAAIDTDAMDAALLDSLQQLYFRQPRGLTLL